MHEVPQPPDQGPWPLADRITALLTSFNAQGERSPTLEMVVREIQARGGEMSIGYLSQLRTGRSANPRLGHLEALAGYFGVPVHYFTDDAESRRVAEELRFLRTLPDDVRPLALRASYMDDKTREALGVVIDKMAPPLPTD